MDFAAHGGFISSAFALDESAGAEVLLTNWVLRHDYDLATAVPKSFGWANARGPIA
jgi:hypothetical protein